MMAGDQRKKGTRWKLAWSVCGAVALILAGCGGPSGGGTTTIDQRLVAYGIGKGGVTFVLFTDLPSGQGRARSGGKSGLFHSQQTGSIRASSGPGIDYVGDGRVLSIEGRKYRLPDGRVFLVTTGNGSVEVEQLDVPIHSTEMESEAFREEVGRLAENERIRAFLAKPNEK